MASLSLLALPACDECDSSIDPVKCTDLCTQDPPHADCAQCAGDTKAENCPQCRGETVHPDCVNADGGGGVGGTTGGMGGTTGGMGGTTGGTGGATGGMGGTTGGMGGIGGVVPGGSGGDAGGTGGDAGDAGPPPMCTDDGNCTPDFPLCSVDGECGPCATSDVCLAEHPDVPLCDAEGRCVECLSEANCNAESSTPKCFAGACTECAVHDDCDDEDFPKCSAAGACVPCTDEEGGGCAERVGLTHCDDRDGSSTFGQCLRCLEHSDCENPTPQCNAAGECERCSANDDACATRMTSEGVAIHQCNTRSDMPTSGQCVQCTADNEELAISAGGCGTNSCNQALGTCTATERGDVQDPCLPCVADSECGTGMKCVTHRIGSIALGSFCFLARTASGCADSNLGIKPHSRELMTESLDGPEDDFCLPPTSCAAYFDAIDDGASGGRACGGSEPLCGYGDLSVDSALCIASGTPSLNNRCSYQCDSNSDCPAGTGFTACPAAAGIRYCRPP